MGSKIDEQLKVFMENIAYLRRKHGLSKAEMANVLGVGVKTLERIENGELPKRVGTRIIFRIQEYFHLSPSEQFHKL